MNVVSPQFFATYQAAPTLPFATVLKASLRSLMHAVDARVDVEGEFPRTPALLCTNSTQRYDFIALMKAVDQEGGSVVTVTKAKNFHNPLMSAVMKRSGVLPLASRGYFILADFVAVFGRRPTDDEYRALRRHLDVGDALPWGGSWFRLQHEARAIGGRPFDPTTTTYREALETAMRLGAAETTRLGREAIAAGHHVQIYPEGTVSPRLGTGRRGAVQLAHALGVPLIPVGMSGCPGAFVGATPLPKRGRITVRVGAPIAVDLPKAHRAFVADDEQQHRETLDAQTATLMNAINDLLDEPHRRATSSTSSTATPMTRTRSLY